MTAARDPHAIKALTPADLIDEYRGLVVSIVNNLRETLAMSVSVEDLESYAYEGLLIAQDGFDPAANNLFATYAYYRIRGAVLDGCRREGWLSRPRKARQFEAIDDLLETNAAAEREAPRPRTLDEAVERVADVVDAAATVFLISESTLERTVSVPPTQEQVMQRKDERAWLRFALGRLSDQEREVVQRFHLDEQSMDEIAANFGKSRSWVSRVNTRALDKMRTILTGRLE